MKGPIIIDGSMALAEATALMLAMSQQRKPIVLTPEREARLLKRKEIEAWNREVEARKAAKKASRSTTTNAQEKAD